MRYQLVIPAWRLTFNAFSRHSEALAFWASLSPIMRPRVIVWDSYQECRVPLPRVA